MNQCVQFYLSLVVERDEQTGDFTVFYAQFPEAIAQGKTKEEAIQLLNEILPYTLEERKEEFLQYHSNKAEVTQQQFYAVVA